MGWIRSEWTPVVWVLPVLALVSLFTFYPVGYTLWTSVHSVLVILPITPFVGIKNYVAVVESPLFWEAMRHSLWFTLMSVPLTVLVGFFVARLLLTRFTGRVVVRSVVVLPWVLPGTVAGALWAWIFHPSWGILNLVLDMLGVIDTYVPWTADPLLVKGTIVIAHVWTQFPFAAVLLMAALVTIDSEMYDAAEVEGASAWQRFRYVTLPHIKPMVVILCVYESLIGLTTYDLVYGMTGGGPGTATTLIAQHIWKESFSMLNFGTGSALAFIIVLLSLGFIFFILKAIPSDLFAKE
ncbi:MAG: carbohydrate ABC transporter permease [Alphaproteobacteria bacterium]